MKSDRSIPRSPRRSLWSATLPVELLLLCAAASALHAQELPIEMYGAQGTAGIQITTPLVQASDGDFYVVTQHAGGNGDGSIIRLSPAGVAEVVYRFTALDGNGFNADGAGPVGGLMVGRDGNLYGTTSQGGTHGVGTLFRFTTDGTFTTLANLLVAPDSTGSLGRPVEDSGADFFYIGSPDPLEADNICEVAADGSVLTYHTFTPLAQDGTNPEGGTPSVNLVIDGADNLYGFCSGGGAHADGTFFEITSAGQIVTLYSYGGTDDVDPHPMPSLNGTATIVAASNGTIYGVGGAVEEAGANESYVIFEASAAEPPTTIYTFSAATYDGNSGLFVNDDGDNPNGLTLGSDGNLYGSTQEGGATGEGVIFQVTTGGGFTVLYTFPSGSYTSGVGTFTAPVLGTDGDLYGTDFDSDGPFYGLGDTLPSSFFTGQVYVDNGVYYLSFSNGNIFGYYSYLTDPNYIYHFDLGYEYVFDANDGKAGVYFYDFASSTFFYTSPTFPFPYLYDFSLNTVLYYYPDPNNPGHYNTDGVRYFYDFATGQIITK